MCSKNLDKSNSWTLHLFVCIASSNMFTKLWGKMNLVNTPPFFGGAGELKVAMVLDRPVWFSDILIFSTSNYQVPWKMNDLCFLKKGPFLLIKRMFYLPTINFQEIWLLFKGMKAWYCWWTKSCTTWDVWNPVNIGINYLSTGVITVALP